MGMRKPLTSYSRAVESAEFFAKSASPSYA